MNIAIVFGSVRTERVGFRVVHYLTAELKKRNHDVSIIDPIEYNLPMLDKMFKDYKQGEAPEKMQKLAEILEKADGFIMVSAEYNHSVPPALKNLLDHFQREYFFKPCGICTYSVGAFGGITAASHLRVILSELGMVTVSASFPVPTVTKAMDENGKLLEEKYDKFAIKFLSEFEWYLKILAEGRKNGLPY